MLLVVRAAVGLWRHVQRTTVMLARLVEVLRHGDFAACFEHRGGLSFTALDGAMQRLQAQGDRSAQDQRYLDALIDDMPVALLTVAPDNGVTLRNRAARRLFAAHGGVRVEDFATYGATIAARLAGANESARELVILDLPGGPQRAILRIATLHRLSTPIRAVHRPAGAEHARCGRDGGADRTCPHANARIA